jgi:hypothetical protein
MPNLNSTSLPALWLRYKTAAVSTIVLSSFALTLLSAPKSDLRLQAVGKFGVALIITEALFTLGALLMATSVGLEVAGANRLHRVYRILRQSRARARQMATEILESKLFALGFWMNFAGAVGTSVILISVVASFVPTTGWGLLLLLFLDLLATFLWRVPLHIKRKKSLASKRITIRRARFSDVDAYLSLQSKRWNSDNMANREQLTSRLESYPQGMLVAELAGEIVGMVYAMRITKYDYKKLPSWNEITHNGYCDNADPKGAALFGVDLTTAPGVGHLAGDKLLIGIARLAISEGVKTALLGGRLPGYHKVADNMTAENYLWAKDQYGRPLDRQVRYYTSVPGLRAVKLLPDYFNDPESQNYGVLLRWHNPLYGLPGRKLWASIFPILFRLEELWMKSRPSRAS